MITNEDKLQCAKRELGMRERVYERRVAEHKMRKEVADREIALMAAIVADYEEKVAAERLYLSPPAIPLPSQKRLRELLDYDPETGVLTWRESGRRAMTSDHGDGYLVGKIDGVQYRAHRIIFKWYHDEEPEQIDHEDHDRANNRIGNLLPSTHLQNGRNQKRSSRNRSGVTGVHFNARQQLWYAKVRVGNERIHLGCFSSKEEAIAVRLAKQKELGFSDGHGT